MQDVIAAVVKMKRDECLEACTTEELARELIKREDVGVLQEYIARDIKANFIVVTKDKII